MCERYLLLGGEDWWQLDDTYLALWCVFTQTRFSSGTWGIKEKPCSPTRSFPASPKQSRMTKAPFSVEWLSQSSQTLKSPTEGSPHRASSAGHQPGSGSSPGLSERSKERSAGSRDGRGGRSRERLAGPPAAGNRGRRGMLALPRCEEQEDGRALCHPQGPAKVQLCRGCLQWADTPEIPGPSWPFSPSPLCPGAGGRPWGAGQAAPEGSAECSGPAEPGGRSGRRLRTAFSAEQISTLESSFQRQQYLGAAERRRLAGRMRLSEVQVSAAAGHGVRDRSNGFGGWAWHGLGAPATSSPSLIPLFSRSRPGFRTAGWSSSGSYRSWGQSPSAAPRCLTDFRAVLCPCRSHTWRGHHLCPGKVQPLGASPWRRCRHPPWTSAAPAEHTRWAFGQHPAW